MVRRFFHRIFQKQCTKAIMNYHAARKTYNITYKQEAKHITSMWFKICSKLEYALRLEK